MKAIKEFLKPNWWKVILILFGLTGLVGFMYLHNTENLSGRHYYEDEFIITSIEELTEFITSQHRASANMNLTEIAIWIFIPSVYIALTVRLWKRKNLLRWFIALLLISFLTIYSIAFFTNQIGVNRYIKNELSNKLIIWEKAFEAIKYPRVTQYKVKDVNSWETGLSGEISFSTSDDISMVKEYYENKGVLDEMSISKEDGNTLVSKYVSLWR